MIVGSALFFFCLVQHSRSSFFAFVLYFACILFRFSIAWASPWIELALGLGYL